MNLVDIVGLFIAASQDKRDCFILVCTIAHSSRATGTERLGKKKEEYECYPHVPKSSLMLILCHISVLLGAMETVTLRNQRK